MIVKSVRNGVFAKSETIFLQVPVQITKCTSTFLQHPAKIWLQETPDKWELPVTGNAIPAFVCGSFHGEGCFLLVFMMSSISVLPYKEACWNPPSTLREAWGGVGAGGGGGGKRGGWREVVNFERHHLHKQSGIKLHLRGLYSLTRWRPEAVPTMPEIAEPALFHIRSLTETTMAKQMPHTLQPGRKRFRAAK